MSDSANVDQSLPNCKDDELRGVMNAKSLHDIGTVYIYRVLAETELGSNLSVGFTTNDQL